MTPAPRMMSEPEHPERALRLRVVAAAGSAGAGVTQPRDADLFRAFLAGDERAFAELVRRHERVVLSIVRRYAAGPDDARDLAQRAFIKAFEAARRAVRGREAAVPFRALLLRTAVNLGKNAARDAARWRRAPVEAIDAQASAAPTAPDAIERAEREGLVRAAVLKLPRRQREVLTLRIDAELSFAEIGAVLGITENNAKVHFHYAARRLRDAITRAPGDEL